MRLATPVNLRRGTSGGTRSASDVDQFWLGFWPKVRFECRHKTGEKAVVVFECSFATRAFVGMVWTKQCSPGLGVERRCGNAGAMTWDLVWWVCTGTTGKDQTCGYDCCRQSAADAVFFSSAGSWRGLETSSAIYNNDSM